MTIKTKNCKNLPILLSYEETRHEIAGWSAVENVIYYYKFLYLLERIYRLVSEQNFFQERTEQSQVKAEIVSKYFEAWSGVITPTAEKGSGRIAYIDLFSGPGRYSDGTKSTPVMILEKAINKPALRERLVTIFNDKEESHIERLREEIEKIPGLKKLRYQPQLSVETVDENVAKKFEELALVPTLLFADPCGYKGLSLRLIKSVLKNWGCDCIFFFNYNRINSGLSNPRVMEHMNALFGKERADELRERIKDMDARGRELAIIAEVVNTLKGEGGEYVLPFGFKNDQGTRTTHHLIFVCKHFKGYEIMKDIMAKESSSKPDGVPSFEYTPADKRFPTLFALSRPLDDLEKALLTEFAGRTLTIEEIYMEHSVGTPYIKKNYRNVLIRLESAGKIIANPSKRRSGTFAKHVKVTFPKGDD